MPAARAARALALLLGWALVGCGSPAGSIGAVLAPDGPSGGLVVEQTPPGLAAAEGGLAKGDEILFVDGRDVRDLSRAEVRDLLRGEVGSPVTLTVLRRGQVERFRVLRGRLGARPTPP